jgi:hypothetical protein
MRLEDNNVQFYVHVQADRNKGADQFIESRTHCWLHSKQLKTELDHLRLNYESHPQSKERLAIKKN